MRINLTVLPLTRLCNALWEISKSDACLKVAPSVYENFQIFVVLNFINHHGWEVRAYNHFARYAIFSIQISVASSSKFDFQNTHA